MEIDGTQNKNDVECNIICLGVTGMQSESSVNDSTIEEGFTFVTQLDSKRENMSIKGNP